MMTRSSLQKGLFGIGRVPPRKLKRSINLFQAIMYGVGLILGAGIYVILGDAAGVVGNAMWISFIVASIIALFTGLSYTELSSMFPKSAAEYVTMILKFTREILDKYGSRKHKKEVNDKVTKELEALLENLKKKKEDDFKDATVD